jgi:hypothetical protein
MPAPDEVADIAVGGNSNLLQALRQAPMALAKQVCGNVCIGTTAQILVEVA